MDEVSNQGSKPICKAEAVDDNQGVYIVMLISQSKHALFRHMLKPGGPI